MKLFVKLTWQLQQATKIGLMLVLSLLCVGCTATKVMVIPSDKEVHRMEQNKNYTFPINGWFVPDARMLEMMHQLERDASQTNTTASARSYT